MGKENGSVFLTITRLCTDGYSTVNLVTDNLQRTCTGTIIIELSGSGYETGTQDNSGGGSNTGGSTEGGSTSGSGSSSEGGTSGNTSTQETQVSTGSWDNNNNGGGNTYENGDGDITDRQLTGDNVHLGPAGIGLLVMGFLILGCKCFNTSFGMGLSKKMGKEIGFLFFDKI